VAQKVEEVHWLLCPPQQVPAACSLLKTAAVASNGLAKQKEKEAMEENLSQHYWNNILAQEGLSVWSGSDHRLVYFERPPDHSEQDYGRRSGGFDSDESNKPARRYIKLGGAGDSQTSLYNSLALTALSKKDQTFLEHYQTESVPQIAAAYGITSDAVHSRIKRLRQKLQNISLQLEQY
jgi:hypothetical protein